MGSYATTTGLQVIMIGTNFDTLTSALASKCIDQAESEVNKFISKRYDVSSFMAACPPAITAITENYAMGLLYYHNSRGSKEGLARGKAFIDLAVSNLKEIAEYKVNLVNTAGSLINDMSNTAYRVLCNTETYSPTFNEDDPLNWSINSTKLDDIKSERD